MKGKTPKPRTAEQLLIFEKELLEYFYLMGGVDAVSKTLSKGRQVPDFEKRYKEQSKNIATADLMDCIRSFIRSKHLSWEWEKWLKDWYRKPVKKRKHKKLSKHKAHAGN